MAIDTRDKRSSAIYVGTPFRGQLPAPVGAVVDGDRAHVAFMYRGFYDATVYYKTDRRRQSWHRSSGS